MRPKKCKDCGANLDPEERCDCKKILDEFIQKYDATVEATLARLEREKEEQIQKLVEWKQREIAKIQGGKE